MVRVEVIVVRLNKLQVYLDVLASKHAISFEEYSNSVELQAVVERFLELSIQAINDIGSHIVADLKLGAIEAYSDIPRLLHKQGYIEQGVADEWVRMCGFRNVLSYDYVKIDSAIVYRVLKEHEILFKQIAEMFASFL
jgi:uncharacterized protein YutE (UPF0331/DUF86 family)